MFIFRTAMHVVTGNRKKKKIEKWPPNFNPRSMSNVNNPSTAISMLCKNAYKTSISWSNVLNHLNRKLFTILNRDNIFSRSILYSLCVCDSNILISTHKKKINLKICGNILKENIINSRYITSTLKYKYLTFYIKLYITCYLIF